MGNAEVLTIDDLVLMRHYQGYSTYEIAREIKESEAYVVHILEKNHCIF